MLIALLDAAHKELFESVLFIKRRKAVCLYHKIFEHMEITNVPTLMVLADVHTELLFELYAAVVIEKDRGLLSLYHVL